MGKRSELTPFGRQVKIRLLERGMDAAELARRVGTSPVQISRILHGKRPGREQIPKIASELGMSVRAAEGRLYRIKKRLRGMLGGEGDA